MLPPDPKSLPTKAGGAGASPADAEHAPPLTGGEAELPAGPPPPPAALSAAPSLSTLMHAFRRCWKLAVPVALLAGLLAAAAGWLLAPKEYTSFIVFRILSCPPHGSLENEDSFANVQKAQVGLMKSHDILSEAIEKSRAAELYGVNFKPQQLQKKLVASFNEGPELAVLSYAGPHPEAVAALLNALGEVYPARVAAADEARIKSRIAQLRRRQLADPQGREAGRPPTMAEQLHDKRVELTAAEQKAGLLDAAGIRRQQDEAVERFREAQQELRRTRLARAGMEAEIASKENRLESPPLPVVTDTETEEAIRNEPSYQKLLKSISTKQEEIDSLRTVGNLKDRVVRASLRNKESELDLLERERKAVLREAGQRVARKLQARTVEQDRKTIVELKDKIELAKRQEATLEAEARKQSAQVELYRSGGPRPPPEVEALRDQLSQLVRENDRIGVEVASLQGALPLNPRVTVQAEAFVPTEMDLNKPIKFSLAGGVGVFGLLLAGMCLLEARGRRVYAADDITQGLGMRVVGTLPRLPASARSHAGSPQSLGGLDSQLGLTEAVDAIRTMLLHAPRVDGARIVMITSAAGGEGKTTLASHLAASLARAWRKTLLVDGDLRNPAQHTQFDQPLEPGLSEALRGEVEFEDAVKPTLTSRLWLMPAGKLDGHALQALAQEGVGAVFARLADQYDFIVLDTSPVLPVPDALLLGQQADVVLLSVMRDVSRLPAVWAAQQKLESLGIRLLGAVVIGEKTETYGRPVPYPRPA